MGQSKYSEEYDEWEYNKSRKINLAFMHQIKQNFLPQNKFFKDKYFIGIIITSLSHWDENSQLYLF